MKPPPLGVSVGVGVLLGVRVGSGVLAFDTTNRDLTYLRSAAQDG